MPDTQICPCCSAELTVPSPCPESIRCERCNAEVFLQQTKVKPPSPVLPAKKTPAAPATVPQSLSEPEDDTSKLSLRKQPAASSMMPIFVVIAIGAFLVLGCGAVVVLMAVYRDGPFQDPNRVAATDDARRIAEQQRLEKERDKDGKRNLPKPIEKPLPNIATEPKRVVNDPSNGEPPPPDIVFKTQREKDQRGERIGDGDKEARKGASVDEPVVKPEPKTIVRPDDAKPAPKDPVVIAPKTTPIEPAVAKNLPIKTKRLHALSDEDLRKQLHLVTEIGFNQPGAASLYAPIRKSPGGGMAGNGIVPDVGFAYYAQLAKHYKRTDWLALPWKMGQNCQLGHEHAERLQVYSVNLRRLMRESTPSNDIRPDPEKLRKSLLGGGPSNLTWDKIDALPTLVQMLQPEGRDLRMILVELLEKIDGKEATAALVQRAVYDVEVSVRERAVEALAKRNRAEYEPNLMQAMNAPWPPAAMHASEAIVSLNAKNLLPHLIQQLRSPDPRLPVPQMEKNEKVFYTREFVRVNHLSNCALCHAFSNSKDDLVRGRIPMPGEDPPPQYYQAATGLFVRADITYLRQDFSLVQPVTNPGKWSGYQRFDYLIRTRRSTPVEIKLYNGLAKDNRLLDPSPQREATLSALRQLTNSDLGNTFEAWMPLLNPIRKSAEPVK